MGRSAAAEHRERELESRAWKLRVAGLTYEAIAEQENTSTATAFRRVKRYVERIPQEEVAEVRARVLDTLDFCDRLARRVATRTHYSHTQSGKIVRDPVTGDPLVDDSPVLAAVDRILKIIETRTKLLGINEPSRTRVEIVTDEDVEGLVRQLEREIAEYEQSAGA